MANYPIATVTRALAPGVDELLYTVPADREFATITVNLAPGAIDAAVSLAYGTGAAPAAGGYVLNGVPVIASGAPARLERDLITPGVKVWATASAAGVSAILTGMEQGA
jgi:hypothetical protein